MSLEKLNDESKIVSIPYRYSINLKAEKEYKMIAVFQFLIGIL